MWTITAYGPNGFVKTVTSEIERDKWLIIANRLGCGLVTCVKS